VIPRESDPRCSVLSNDLMASSSSNFGALDGPRSRKKNKDRRIFEVNTVFHKSDKSREFKSNKI
jgi:hypothetical protein